MTEVRSNVTVHPETVAKAESVAKELRKAKKAAPQKRKSKVVKTKVDPRIWEKALELSGNHPKRIRVESETCVVVENRDIK